MTTTAKTKIVISDVTKIKYFSVWYMITKAELTYLLQ